MKTKLIYLILLFSIQLIYSQIEPEWVVTFNGPDNGSDSGRGVALDNGGNVYVTGTIQTAEGYNIITIKYNSSGELQWQKFFEGFNDGVRNAIALDESGNVFIGGSSRVENNDPDYLIIKYDNNGNLLWSRTYNYFADDEDNLRAITTDKFGNVYVTGGSVGYDIYNTEDILTIKYNADGDSIWTNRYDGPESFSDAGVAIVADTLGNVYVLGAVSYPSDGDDFITIKYNVNGEREWIKIFNNTTSASPDEDPQAITLDPEGNVIVVGKAGFDFVTLKYSNDGNLIWQKLYHSLLDGQESAKDVAADLSGNIFVTGESRKNQVGFLYEFTTIKYDANGELQWIRNYTHTANSSDRANFITLDSLGNIFVTGHSFVVGIGNDILTIKYDSNANLLWTNTFDGSANSNDWPLSMAIDKMGSVLVTGITSSTGAGYDIVTIKYPGNTTNLENPGDLYVQNYSLAQNYPNPFNPVTTIQYSIPQRSSVTLKVYDVLGNEVAALVNEEKDRGVYSVNFDASQLASGMYLYRIQAGSFVETKKMILIK